MSKYNDAQLAKIYHFLRNNDLDEITKNSNVFMRSQGDNKDLVNNAPLLKKIADNFNEGEFITFAFSNNHDLNHFPAVRLTKQEMAAINGGWFWIAVGIIQELLRPTPIGGGDPLPDPTCNEFTGQMEWGV